MQGNTHRNTMISLLALTGIFLFAACQSSAENTSPTEAETPATPTFHPVADSTSSDEETSSDDPVGEVQSTDECIVCHTDKQMLIDTAEPEVDLHAENEGAG